MAENEYPWILPDSTVEQTITNEDGDENSVFFSVTPYKDNCTLVLFCKNYGLSWNSKNPNYITVRREQRDAKPIINMGLSAEILTESGSNSAKPDKWVMLFPDYTMYRNKAFFYHQTERTTLKFQSEGQNGGVFQVAVTCSIDTIRYSVAYFPPNDRGIIKRVKMMLYEDGNGSMVDGKELFTARSTHLGTPWQTLDIPIYQSGDGDFMTPPFCYPIHRAEKDEWYGISVEPNSEQMKFSRFDFDYAEPNRLAVRLTYDSPIPCKKSIVFPTVSLSFGAKDEYDALKKYADSLVSHGLISHIERKQPEWWKKPIVCGWREQTNIWQKNGGNRAYLYCRQEVYENLINKLEELQIPFGTVVIDAIWSIAEEFWEIDKEKWPDMRGFINRMHEKGKRVLLWVCPNTGALPDSECLICEYDEKSETGEINRRRFRLVDPLSPEYRKRIYNSFHTMFGSENGCLNADGIKLDYTGGMPYGEIVRCTKPLYGYEYLKAQFSLFHDGAKAAKPDSLLVFQSSNPYLAECFDMARLNDYLIAPCLGRAFNSMEIRKRISESVNYGALIDVDGIRSIDYINRMDLLGIPSIYLGIDDFERTPEYVSAAKDTFERYLKNLK